MRKKCKEVDDILLSIKDRYCDEKIINKLYEPKNIMLTTIETRNISILKPHNDTVNYYAKKHGYKYIFLNEYENALSLPIYWKNYNY